METKDYGLDRFGLFYLYIDKEEGFLHFGTDKKHNKMKLSSFYSCQTLPLNLLREGLGDPNETKIEVCESIEEYLKRTKEDFR